MDIVLDFACLDIHLEIQHDLLNKIKKKIFLKKNFRLNKIIYVSKFVSLPVNPAMIRPKLIGTLYHWKGNKSVSMGSTKLPGLSRLTNPSITITFTKHMALIIPSNEKYERYFIAIMVNGVINNHAITFNNIIDTCGKIACNESPIKMTSATPEAISSRQNNAAIYIRDFSPNATAPNNNNNLLKIYAKKKLIIT